MKYFCILILIIITACSKSSDKQMSNKQQNENDEPHTNTVVINTDEINDLISSLENNMELNEILLQYMKIDIYRSTNDLIPKEIVAKLNDEAKKTYAEYIIGLFRDVCRIRPKERTTEKLVSAYRYLDETKLFDALNIKDKSSIYIELTQIIALKYSQSSEYRNGDTNYFGVCLEMMNHLGNLIDQPDFNHYSYYFNFGDLYTKMECYEPAKEYYLKMLQYAKNPREHQFAMEHYYVRGTDHKNFDEYRKSIFEFLKTADPQYSSYNDAVDFLATAIDSKIGNDLKKEIIKEMNDKKMKNDLERGQYLNEKFDENFKNIKKSIIEEVNSLKGEQQ